MRLSSEYLQNYQGIHIASDQLADRLTMGGLELDELIPLAPPFSGVIVAEVRSMEKHPDADKLRIARVFNGREELQIVCGAPNLTAPSKVPLATIGAELPGGLKIKKGKLRGVESFGMLCSARELGLSEESSGLLLLPADAPVGLDIREYLRLNGEILDLNVTPNRGDCLSHRGLVREIALLCRDLLPADFKAQEPAWPEFTDRGSAPPLVKNEATLAACPAYHLRAIRGLDNRRPTPDYMVRRLEQAGLRCHDPLVDITNFVMLELGTPLHAFNSDQISGPVQLRWGRAGEKLPLLNGSEAALDSDFLLIADEEKALAVAGVMGGQASSCSTDTRNIYLESAWFNPTAIAGRARRLNLSSDAAARFERGVDYQLQRRALDYATALILEICGGEASPVAHVGDASLLPQRPPINLDLNRVEKWLGRSYEKQRVVEIFTALGCTVADGGEGLAVTAPSWRFDLTIPEDLIEEIARVDGYGQIPDLLPPFPYQERDDFNPHWPAEQLAALGFNEAITYSFLDPQLQEAFKLGPAIDLQNPISAHLSQLRLSLIPNLVQAVQYNRNRQQPNLRLFEIGRVFLGAAEQPYRVAGVLAGLAAPESALTEKRPVDFYDGQAAVRALLGPRPVQFVRSQRSFLHPGQSADVILNGRTVGWLGALHPALLEELAIKGGEIFCFELEMAALAPLPLPRYRPLPRFPAVRRDLALLVPKELPAETLLAAARQQLGDLLSDGFCFDVYESATLGARKSLALALICQNPEKTLQDEELNPIIDALIKHLKDKFDADLR